MSAGQMGLMNSGTLRALANATSGQHESLGRMNVPHVSKVSGNGDTPLIHSVRVPRVCRVYVRIARRGKA